MTLTYGSVCSGIEAPSVAWHSLGWKPVWFSEVDAFPSAVLAHHWPDVPNEGDMTWLPLKVSMGEIPAPDVLVGGTPCQSFSIAGMRAGLSDSRGQLTLKFVELANEIDTVRIAAGQPECIVVWENVPGVLSSRDNAFGCFLAALAGEDEPYPLPNDKAWAKCGVVFGPQRAIAWRVLDAQYFGVAQRRRRVFVVASARAGFHSSQVLLEHDSLRRDSAPSREAGEGSARGAADRAGSSGWPADVTGTLDASFGKKWGLEDQHINSGASLFVPVAFHHNAQASQLPSVNRDTSISDSLTCSQQAAVATPMQVRRLTPRECERLQGFSDDYTLIPWRGKPADQCPDSPRYKVLGNSMAVPVMNFIGRRINYGLAHPWKVHQEEDQL